MSKVFLNDKIVDADHASVPVTDSGLLYGMGLFETMRAASGSVFALDDHLERLFASAKALSVKNPFDKQFISDAIDQVLTANDFTDARMRLTLTNGPLKEQDGKPTLLITAARFEPYPPEYYKKGVSVILTDIRQNPTDPTCRHKTTNYFPRLLALNEAHMKKAAEALWFTDDNRLAEGCISNVFIVKDSAICTPPVETGLLPGIARKKVIELAKDRSIELVEKDITINDLLAAEEVFLTNVVMLVLPVIAIEAHTVADGKPGPITQELTNAFNEILK